MNCKPVRFLFTAEAAPGHDGSLSVLCSGGVWKGGFFRVLFVEVLEKKQLWVQYRYMIHMSKYTYIFEYMLVYVCMCIYIYDMKYLNTYIYMLSLSTCANIFCARVYIYIFIFTYWFMYIYFVHVRTYQLSRSLFSQGSFSWGLKPQPTKYQVAIGVIVAWWDFTRWAPPTIVIHGVITNPYKWICSWPKMTGFHWGDVITPK